MRKFVARLGFGFFSAISVLTLQSVHTNAQSQFQAPGSSPGLSVNAAVQDVQKEILDPTVLGGAGPAGFGAGATGRWRHSSHDGFVPTPDILKNGKTYGFDISERSLFGTFSYQLPGTVFGGSVKASFVIGTNQLDLTVKHNRQNQPPPVQVGGGDNDSLLYGGNLLWFSKLGYVMGTLVGHRGDSTLVGPTFLGAPDRFKYDTDGYVASLVVGTVVPLTSGPTPIKVDLRGSLGRVTHSGDPFISDIFGTKTQFEFSTSSVGFSPMLFIDVPLAGGTLRPYVQGNIKTLFGYDNTTSFTGGFGPPQVIEFDEERTFRGAEVGVNFVSGSWSFGASYYHEQSSDVTTNGGKIGAAYKLN